MTFIRSCNLKPGMILAEDLFGTRNELLLACGQVLTTSQIIKLQMADCEGVYIVDDAADIAEDTGIISKPLRHNTVNALKTLFTHVEAGNIGRQTNSLHELRYYLDEIIDELSANRNAISNMVDIKVFDEYTYYHCVNVAALSILQGVTAGMNRNGLYRLGMGALLHDIGKVFIPKEIVNKPSSLTHDEYELMKQHSMLGSDYLRKQWAMPVESIVAVLTHHERYDGGGYPLQLSAGKQTMEGKIIAICDVYDAMTSERPYRSALSPSEAIEHIMGNAGIMFDPMIIATFMKKITPYPVGSKVKLSNGLKASVIQNNPGGLMRPVVQLIRKNEQGVHAAQEVLDLLNDPALLNITIIGFDK